MPMSKAPMKPNVTKTVREAGMSETAATRRLRVKKTRQRKTMKNDAQRLQIWLWMTEAFMAR